MHNVVVLQVCQAYAADGGRVVVVMTQREKIGMEALFRRIIPPHKRCGCNFVFRQVIFSSPDPSCSCGFSMPSLSRAHAWLLSQGSPLVPADLKMVAAYSAAATVIVSDSSR